MRIPTRLLAVAMLMATAAACSGDDGSDSGDASATSSSAPPATTVAASTTAAAVTSSTSATSTTGATTSAAPTTAAGPTTTEACVAPTTLDPVQEGWPDTLSSLYADDVDTGGHACFERVVFNFAGTGEQPGFWVRYEPDPLVLATSGETTDLRGEANLIVSVGTWAGEFGDFTGETQLFPLNVERIDEVKLIDNFEGVMVWGIGLDQQRPFEVFTLSDPFRLVIDIASL